MRLTANLMKEVKFDATSNKFDYLETLLSEENSKFNQKGKNAVETQVLIILTSERPNKKDEDPAEGNPRGEGPEFLSKLPQIAR